MDVIIPDEIVQATGMSETELRQEVAILFFQKDKLTLGQASRLAGMSQLKFQHLLSSRQIPVHYDVTEFAWCPSSVEQPGRSTTLSMTTHDRSTPRPWLASGRDSDRGHLSGAGSVPANRSCNYT